MLLIIWKANEIRPLNIERAKQFQVSLIIWARYTECLWRNCLLKTRNFTKNVWLLNFFATQQFRSFRWLIFSSILLSKSWKLHKMLDLISSLNFWVRIYGHSFYELSRMLKRKNVKNDVSKDSPILEPFLYSRNSI